MNTRFFMTAVTAVLATTAAAQAQQQQQQQQNQRWTQERAVGDGTTIMLSPAAVRLIQQALNRQGYSAGTLNGTWNDGTRQAARAYQAANDLEPTGTPTIGLINALGGFSVISGSYGEGRTGAGGQRWVQETAADSGTSLYASPAQVRQIQQAINAKGYDCGTVDGTWGSQTGRCATAFQAANNLEPNGRLTVALITALGGNQSIFSSGPGSQQQSGQSGQRWTQETTAGPGTEIWASPATVRVVQQGLNQAGYDAGQLDGNWSRSTTQAAKAFQAANGLEPTGTLTTALLANLGMSQWYTGRFQPSATAATGSGGGMGQHFGQGQFMNRGQQFGQANRGFGQGNQRVGQGQQFGQGNQGFGQGQQFGQGNQRVGQGQQFGQGNQGFGQGQQFGQSDQGFGQGQQSGQGNQGFGQGQGQQFGQSDQGFGQGQQSGQGYQGFGQGQGKQFSQGNQANTQGQGQQSGGRVQSQSQVSAQPAGTGTGTGEAGTDVQQQNRSAHSADNQNNANGVGGQTTGNTSQQNSNQ
ncbi:MAG: peptidoglycan-binding domain-containing protein [Hyphomicrobiaceae bacterium]